MNTTDLEFFKNLFLDLIKYYSQQSESPENLPTSKGDEIDRIVEDRDNLLRLKLQGRRNHYIKKLGLALIRIEEGIFGECEECGGDIEKKRLLARPTATYCITCKEDQEREENHILYDKKSHTLGRTFVNSNILTLPTQNEEILKEKVLEFNKKKINIGLSTNL